MHTQEWKESRYICITPAGLLTSLVDDEVLKIHPNYTLLSKLGWFILFCFTVIMFHMQRHHATVIFGEKQTQHLV